MSVLFSDYTFRLVSIGALILGSLSGLLGCYTVLKKQSLLADGISHSALPGVVIIFMIFNKKELGYLLIGAIITGSIAQALIQKLATEKAIGFDGSLAVILSSFFGLGMMGLSYIQRQPTSNQAGLARFIFGQASTMLERDIYLMIVVAIIVIFLTVLFRKELMTLIFDREYCQILGFNVKFLDSLLSIMMVITIMVGLQSVGVILMSAMMIAPACAARQWTNHLKSMLILASIFGGFSGVVGTIVSSSISKMPTGPSIVLVMGVIVMVSLLFGPDRGIVAKYLAHKKLVKEIKEYESSN